MPHAHVDESNSISMALRRMGVPPRWQVLLLILGSLLIASVCALATGGARSPFLGLFVVPILLAAAYIGPLAGIIIALIGVGISGLLLAFGPRASHSAQMAVLGNAILLVLVALFIGFLFRRIGLTTQRLELRASQAMAMDDLSRMMESTYDLETALNLVIIILRMLFPMANACAIFLADPRGERLELKASSGLDDEQARAVPLLMEEEEHGWAPADGIPLLVCNATQQPHTKLSQIFPQAGCYLWVPLRSVEGVIGLIAVASGRADELTDRELHLAELLAGRVAFPIERTRLQQDLQRMAFTDALTGIYNHRYFREELRVMVDQSKRYGHPLSLIMIDVDEFKQVNDAHGHRAGDRALGMLAGLMERETRDADILARYGGEEFAVICPETPKDAAVALAKRLRDAVRREEFHLRDEITVRLSISEGIASFPEDGESPETLIERADEALYQAKHAGRNSIRVAGADVAPGA